MSRSLNSHRGVLRGVEAAIAIMLLLMSFSFLYSVQFTFKPHETRSLSIIASSIVLTYQDAIARYVSMSDLMTLESLLDAVVPDGYGYSFQVEYFQPVRVLFGSQGYRPVGFTADFPYSVDAGSVRVKDARGIVQDTQVVWSWYRVPFQVYNDESAGSYESTLAFDAPWQDSNQDGALEPVDEGSFVVYVNSTRWEYSLVNITRADEAATVYVNVTLPLYSNETVDGFFYFKVVS